MGKMLFNMDEQKLVGAFMPLQFTYYLELFILAKGLTKTGIIQSALFKWYESIALDNLEDKLTDEIVGKIMFQYKNRGKMTNKKFKAELEKTLYGRHLPIAKVTEIINKIKWDELK